MAAPILIGSAAPAHTGRSIRPIDSTAAIPFRMDVRIVLSSLFNKKGRDDHGLDTEKPWAVSVCPRPCLLGCSRALRADLPKKTEKAEKSKKAAHAVSPMHAIFLYSWPYNRFETNVSIFFCSSDDLPLTAFLLGPVLQAIVCGRKL
jgi:hypothetical protein